MCNNRENFFYLKSCLCDYWNTTPTTYLTKTLERPGKNGLNRCKKFIYQKVL